MTKRYDSVRYSRAIVVLHWLMLLQMMVVYGFIELREIFPKGTEPRELMKEIHYMLGLTVLALVIVRLYFKATTHAPAIQPAPAQVIQCLSKTMHFILYALMIGMPIAGWMMLSAAGKPIPFFGLALPALVAENKELADTIKELHKTAGSVGYLLIAGHALAGLYHHYIVRDNTLKRLSIFGK